MQWSLFWKGANNHNTSSSVMVVWFYGQKACPVMVNNLIIINKPHSKNWAHKTSLTSSPFIEVHAFVSSQESERSCMCVLRIACRYNSDFGINHRAYISGTAHPPESLGFTSLILVGSVLLLFSLLCGVLCCFVYLSSVSCTQYNTWFCMCLIGLLFCLS